MITLKNVKLQIENQLLLENEDIYISKGNVHVIVGESGSGKTTLLYELSLLSHCSQTIYLWDERRIDGLNEFEKSEIRRTNIGYIMQDLELISENLSLHDNIRCMFALSGQDYDEIKVQEYMDSVNLKCSLEQTVSSMSNGERQRFALVLALVKNADLIICDEPTSSLDIDNTIELMNHLCYIAKKYNKMVVIATHDLYVIKSADILYEIKNRRLLLRGDIHLNEHNKSFNENLKIKKEFYKTYNKSNSSKTNLIIQGIYIVAIMLLCIIPLSLNSLLDREERLYNSYASNEIIVVNTQEVLPHLTYSGIEKPFNNDQINMLQEIDNVKEVNYYWELEGLLSINGKSEKIIIMPKTGIKKLVLSSSLSNKIIENMILNASLLVNKREYNFDIKLQNYNVEDYLVSKKISDEVIYMPFDMIKDMLKKAGIETSDSIYIECDKIEKLEHTSSEIQRWLKEATISSTSIQYLEQIKELEAVQQFIGVLRIVLVGGIVAITSVIQTMRNKERKKEVNALRINGMCKNAYYRLCFQEDRKFIVITVISCIMGYIGIEIILGLELTVISLLTVIGIAILYIVLTKIIPLYISVRQLFKKNISAILREN